VVARQRPGTRIRIRGTHRDGRAFETAAVLAERTPPGGS
jgi:hypothetical protein